MSMAGGNTNEVRLASFQEHGARGDNAMDRAKAIVACASMGIPFSLAAVPGGNPVNPATLIIGGGIAGIQSALEIANAGKQVFLVEQTGTIGGHMAMFDKTFPTLDCAACILTPKMVSVGQHEMIRLFTRSKVVAVSGRPGSYRVKVRQKARFVDINSCVACNQCAEVCPIKVESEFDAGISLRKAIYIPFPQAVPNAYLVDETKCTYILSDGEKCGICVKKCPKECINLNDTDRTTDIEVGNIILATGYELLDVSKIEQYGYGIYPNVLTSLEFERLTNASGTTGGRIVTKTKYFNKKYSRSGSLFESTFRAALIDNDEYLKYLLVYINVINPGQLIEANLKEDGVKNIDKIMEFAEDYNWSTNKEYLGMRESIIIEKGLLGEIFSNPKDYKEFIKNTLLNKKYEKVNNIILD